MRYAIADLLNRGHLPATARDRFCLLATRYHLSGTTLYRHRDLWHPDHLWITPPDPPATFELSGQSSAEGAPEPGGAPSLFTLQGRNTSEGEGYRQFLAQLFEDTGRNSASGEGFSDLSDLASRLEDDSG